MKIVLIAKQNIEKTYSGATRTVYEQIKYFKGLGHEVHVVGELINKKDLEKSGAIAHKTHRWFWQKKFKRRLQFSKAAQALAKNLSADLVIGHGDLQYQDIFLLHNSVHLAEEKINGKTPTWLNESLYHNMKHYSLFLLSEKNFLVFLKYMGFLIFQYPLFSLYSIPKFMGYILLKIFRKIKS